MKLELKLFSAYMPFGLKCQYFDDERGKMVACDIVELRVDEMTLTDSQNQYEVDFYEVRPILRPISELTDEMAIRSGYKNANSLRLIIVSKLIP